MRSYHAREIALKTVTQYLLILLFGGRKTANTMWVTLSGTP